jgi:DNA-binding Lrp family transcriptional regulator
MVGEMTARRLDRTDWELLIRQYEAGATIADITALTGLSDSWVRNRIRTHSRDEPALRARFHLEALRRELIRTETELLKGGVESAVKRMRALNMLVKLEKELKTAAAPEAPAAYGAEDIAEMRAEIKRRLDRLRATRDSSRISRNADGSGCSDALP